MIASAHFIKQLVRPHQRGRIWGVQCGQEPILIRQIEWEKDTVPLLGAAGRDGDGVMMRRDQREAGRINSVPRRQAECERCRSNGGRTTTAPQAGPLARDGDGDGEWGEMKSGGFLRSRVESTASEHCRPSTAIVDVRGGGGREISLGSLWLWSSFTFFSSEFGEEEVVVVVMGRKNGGAAPARHCHCHTRRRMRDALLSQTSTCQFPCHGWVLLGRAAGPVGQY